MTAAYKCTDNASPASPPASARSPNGATIDTSTVGDHTFTVTATDKAGNQTVVTHTTTVVYTWHGFFCPIANTEHVS